jgi:hypothetical protein
MLSFILSYITCIHTYVGSCYVDTSEDSIGTYGINERHYLMALMNGINGQHNGRINGRH